MDLIDFVTERQQTTLDDNVKKVVERAKLIPVGEPGECLYCGYDSPRLVQGACAPCRDFHKLP